MKLALYQSPSPGGNVEDGFERISTQLRAAAAAGAQMLVLPEMYLPGYNQPRLIATLAQIRDGGWSTRLAKMARDAGCGLTLGWAERGTGAEAGKIFNAATAFDAAGRVLAHYRKIQLFGPMEQAVFHPGDALPPVFELGGRRAALLICYDVEFPAHAARLAEAGAEIVLVPTANPLGYEHVQRLLVPARAYENRQFVAYANFCGSEADLVYGGASLIAGPDGWPLVSAGSAEALLVGELPRVADYPQAFLSTQAADLRLPEMSSNNDQD